MSCDLVLLASYPKSGNTWVRLMLDGLLHGGEININRVRIGNAAERARLDAWLDLETSDLSSSQTANLRPAAYRWAAQHLDGLQVLKVHDAQLPLTSGAQPPFPADAIRAVLHIVRDPRDLAVSLAHHLGRDVDYAIDRMGDDEWVASESRERLRSQVAQLYSSWSRHVESWLDASGMPVLTVRYEDLKRDTEAGLKALADFLGLNVTSERRCAVIAAAAFDRLQAQEQAVGFVEAKRRATAPFFRSGQAGGWKAELSSEQSQRIEARHGVVMARLGYL